jgi:hypothetical protein
MSTVETPREVRAQAKFAPTRTFRGHSGDRKTEVKKRV